MCIYVTQISLHKTFHIHYVLSIRQCYTLREDVLFAQAISALTLSSSNLYSAIFYIFSCKDSANRMQNKMTHPFFYAKVILICMNKIRICCVI